MVQLATAVTVVLLCGILAVVLEGFRRRDYASVANAVVSFAVALVPVVVEVVGPSLVGGSVTIGPELPLWIAAAGFLHSIGMLGPYDTVRWWDTVTHTVSAALVAALVYAGLVVMARHATVVDLSPAGVVVLTVAFTFAAGAFWELIELVARDVGRRFDVEPVLVHYGRRDTAIDLVVDVAGAIVVVLLDLRVFVSIAEQSPDLAARLVLGSGAVIVVGSVVLTVLVARSRLDRS